MTGLAPTLGEVPLSDTGRVPHIDIVRGVAVFGLIWSNLNAGGYTGPPSDAHAIAQWAAAVFSAGKFWTLFSLLFGVSLAIQLDRARATSRAIAGRWLRRMLVLYGIGWAHALLLWPGDILRGYALAGAVLILFRRASNRTILAAAVVAFALAANRESLSVVATRLVRGNVEAVQQRERPDAQQQGRRKNFERATQSGSYVELVGARLATFPREVVRQASPPAGPLNLIDPGVFALFLLGLVLGRRQVLQHPDRHQRIVNAFIAVGGFVGLGLSVYLASRPAWLLGHWLSGPLGVIAQVSLMLGYLGSLLWLLQRPSWQARLRWLGPVGRLGLTNYVAQTAFLTYVQFGYGLGLDPVLDSFECVALALAFYLLQVICSNWWVRHFDVGPVEWFWRRLTHWSVHSAPIAAVAAG